MFLRWMSKHLEAQGTRHFRKSYRPPEEYYFDAYSTPLNASSSSFIPPTPIFHVTTPNLPEFDRNWSPPAFKKEDSYFHDLQADETGDYWADDCDATAAAGDEVDNENNEDDNDSQSDKKFGYCDQTNDESSKNDEVDDTVVLS